jgi:NADPH:quinone reductase-like Zn-dependent oxidoreductase
MPVDTGGARGRTVESELRLSWEPSEENPVPIEARTLRQAAYEALKPEFHLRADRFYNAPDTELDFTEQGGLKTNKDLAYMNELFEAGKLRPVLDGPYKLSDLPEAFRFFSTGDHRGKIIVTMV